MKDYEVGEEFQFGRIKLRVEQCENPISCENCFFREHLSMCYRLLQVIGGCSELRRKDKQSVKFVKVEEDV